MIIFETVFKDVYTEPKVAEGRRGFIASLIVKVLKDLDLDVNFVGDDASFSKYGMLRGVHCQILTSTS
jgi:dTDP-4-dehydrorhamnose 3,5-epimerase-like enzyme